ncbi:sensor histidine kinase KdpD [Pedobacter sp. ASV28]|jgi:two-component system, OmpR family, phosphate regulon sensor histidine kinase PhoR|uniref:sensor histidine kinase n=1 Tax=Pedobacter sp. ASV28 TaxID=2795123 RepID=UPI0018EB23E5|nr:HAMP domain-containing sensor histidine kinase [Pedobacter sp. ASV28]
MDSIKESGYRKNFSLIVTFIGLISALFVLSLFLAFNFSKKKIEGDFISAKTNVLEESIKPYNDFFLNKLPEISYYNGYLDSVTASKFVDTVLLKYPFVKKVVFYDAEIRNVRYEDNGLNVGDFSIGMKNVYQFGSYIPDDSVKIFGLNSIPNNTTLENFNELALKLYTFVQKLDTTKMPSQEDLFSNFTNIKPNRIDYFNIPRFEDLKIYKKMIREKLNSQPVYQQDMLSFELDPLKIKIKNNRPLLYQSVRIEPVTYDPLDTSSEYITGEITLGGPFSAYKLYFISSKSFVKKEILSYFFPIAALILVFYALLLLVAFLIYRNLNINHKMFRLQYDFLTNLTHEFKTPVSVIKIAGNNIKSATSLSEKEQKLYGKILDEEADKLNGLMNKLLAFTQIENKAIKLNQDEVDIVDFIESTIDAYQLKYPDFQLSYEVTDFKHFITDPVLLGSLFDNLVENAYKYSPPNQKQLHITARLIKDKVVLRFKDAGIGIPASEINNIFKKFYRIQNQYNQAGSVGLGLAFCKELVNFMKGEITVRSVVDKGTEFKIVLPYNS